ncbi:NADPH oxidase 5-like [Gigantopelta aegis]|uniref:NADPH oxidase 5-like n=1 Tax=Gigantopelta aegis TaxID=1735272 RepID=UPI001B8873A7|nr:NADPH oxidase 5-like [Gigantopelta aegis]
MTTVKGLTFAPIAQETRRNDELSTENRPITPARRFSEIAINAYRQNRKRPNTLDNIDERPSQSNNNYNQKTVRFENNFDSSEDGHSDRGSHPPNGNTKNSAIEIFVLDDAKVDSESTETRTEFGSGNIKEHKALDEVTDEEWLKWAEAQFYEIAKGKEGIDKKSFKQALRVKESFFADRFFDIFDKDGSGFIDPGELMDGLHLLTKENTTDKLAFLFDVYDQDGSGYIDMEELRTVIQSCTVESSITFGEEELDMLTEALFNNATGKKSTNISFEEFQGEIEKHPIVLENLTLGAAQWLRPPKKNSCSGRHRYFTGRYLLNNLRKIIFIVLYFVANIICFIVGCWNYRTSNGFIIAARGGGLVLNFNCMFILVLMLRKCITWLRTTPIRSLLPLDQHIMIHKLVGLVILGMSVWHTAGHIGNAGNYILLVSADFNLTVLQFVFTTKANIGWISGSAPLTGIILMVILVVMCVFSMPFVRRSGHFQIFYWTHLLYVPFWILLILHCPHFWFWFIAPGVIFLVEKISRSKFIKKMRYGQTFITEVNLLPSKVTHLVITKPANMTYQPGDYIFLQIPELAAHEWHPFTISSSPELEDVFWVHVRSAGHWTNTLYEYFNKYKPPRKRWEECCNSGYKKDTDITLNKGRQQLQPDFTVSFKKKGPRKFKSRKSTYGRKTDPHKEVYIKVYVDGPYGTSSRELFQTEHAVLVASGIGVTPYASVLQSIMYRFLASKRTCPNCEFSWCSELPATIMKLKKVDFIWINRDQKSFEWFVSLLTQLEIEQRQTGSLENILDMHLYMTSALNCTDMKGIGLQMALDLIHQEKQIDLITGLRTRTNPGRPNWNEIFTKLSKQNKGKIKVFFCGSPVLAKQLKAHCQDFGFSFCKENF